MLNCFVVPSEDSVVVPPVIVTHSYEDYMRQYLFLLSVGFTAVAWLPTGTRFTNGSRTVVLYQV